MNHKSKQTMYQLIRDLSDVQGNSRTTIMSLNAFIESIRQLKCKRGEFKALYSELANTVKKAQPNIIPLMHLLNFFECDMELRASQDMDLDTVKKLAIHILEEKIAQFKRNRADVIANGLSYVQDGDTILVHSASTVITNILIQAKEKLNRRFSIIVLDLNPERTRQTVVALRDAGIEHTVIPDHNLSHHIDGASKMFLGAMTVTSDKRIVAPVGTAGTVSQCRHHKIPVHLFANTLYYSRRRSTDQNIFRAVRPAHIGTTDFSLTTHSHDMIDLDFIDHIVAEIGELHPDGLLKSAPVSVSKLIPSEVEVEHHIPADFLPEMAHA